MGKSSVLDYPAVKWELDGPAKPINVVRDTDVFFSLATLQKPVSFVVFIDEIDTYGQEMGAVIRSCLYRLPFVLIIVTARADVLPSWAPSLVVAHHITAVARDAQIEAQEERTTQRMARVVMVSSVLLVEC